MPFEKLFKQSYYLFKKGWYAFELANRIKFLACCQVTVTFCFEVRGGIRCTVTCQELSTGSQLRHHRIQSLCFRTLGQLSVNASEMYTLNLIVTLTVTKLNLLSQTKEKPPCDTMTEVYIRYSLLK